MKNFTNLTIEQISEKVGRMTKINFAQLQDLNDSLETSDAYKKIINLVIGKKIKGSDKQVAFATVLRDKAAKNIAIEYLKLKIQAIQGDNDYDLDKWKESNIRPLLSVNASELINNYKY